MQRTPTQGWENPPVTFRDGIARLAKAATLICRWICLYGMLAICEGTGFAADSATPTVTQTIALRRGWNAIYLTVDPTDSSPMTLFAGTPITKVATYFPLRTPVEYIQDPASAPWKKAGWSIWFAPTLPESAINDLYAILGGQGYLVFATTQTTLSVSGVARLNRIRWRSDSFNLVGFPVDPESPPTFSAWFAGTTAHLPKDRASIFFLDGDGHWRAVDHPESTPIQPNVAYWVFSRGHSDYQGPLDISVPAGGPVKGIHFGSTTETLSVRIRNTTGTPVRFTDRKSTRLNSSH